MPVCLLTTTGRTSGLPRTAPLLHVADGDRVVLVASRGGLPTNPQWYYNLKANPEVQIEFRRTKRSMLARQATAAERAALWPRLVGVYRDFASY